MKRNIVPVLIASVLALAATACQTVPDPATIPTDLTVAELKQNGQTALDSNNFRAAEVYYQTIINRFGTDLAVRTAAEYEIAHLHVKQKRWNEARPMLKEIIARYDSDADMKLPRNFLVLAKNDLKKIPE